MGNGLRVGLILSLGLFVQQTAAAAPLALPLRFEENRGQAAKSVRFVARGSDCQLFLTPAGATLSLDRAQVRALVNLRVVGGRADAELVPGERLSGVSNYFVGDRAEWRTGVEGYASVRARDVLPGVDLVFYGNAQRQFEYDLVVAPGARVTDLALRFDGAEVSLQEDGGATLNLPDGGELSQPAPVAYQLDARGQREFVPVHYELRNGALGFSVAAYDSQRALVIDPTLVYATFLGGSSGDVVNGVALDAAGNAYLAGATASLDFPTASALQTSHAGSTQDVFIAKLSPDGSKLVYSTYLGGSGNEGATAIAVDAAGEAFITGNTDSTNFPLASALQGANGGGGDAFVVKLSASGSALVYSTFLGGSSFDGGSGIAVDAAGRASVGGRTYSLDFRTVSPVQAAFGGNVDGFLAQLNASGSALVYSTYLGGAGFDMVSAVAVDGSGQAVVAGQTLSTNFPTVAALQGTFGGASAGDAFVSKFNAQGSALVYSTYLGGSGDDYAHAIALDSSGAAFVTGLTDSLDFPQAAALQSTYGGSNGDVFISKLTPDGSRLVYSTYLGGSSQDEGFGIAVDASGQVAVAGRTYSPDFPVLAPLQATCGGCSAHRSDAFVAKLDATGASLLYASYLGGDGQDWAQALAMGANGDVIVAGETGSSNFPTRSPLQSHLGDNGNFGDGFVARIATSAPVPAPAFDRAWLWLMASLLLALGSASHRERALLRG